jgi:alpha-N-arabinofuranosidase
MKAALGDAAFMAAMERNSDVIQMQCYAPLFVNVNPGARQWRPDLIGYDALTSYGSPSYYALKMFGGNLGDQILAVAATETSVQGCATRDSKTGAIIVKLVNPLAEPQPLVIDFKGAGSINSTATAITLAAKPEDSNTITEPRKVAPVTTTIRDVKPGFTFTMPPDSVVVLKFTR